MNVEILSSDWIENKPLDEPKRFSLIKTDLNISGFMMGKSPCGCYAITVNPHADDFSDRLFDFIRYENSHDRQVLIFSPEYDVSSLIHNPPKIETTRPYAPLYAVHSTLLTFYEQIIKDGYLKSTARLRNEGVERKAIGFTPLGEPEDYLEYIMFAPVDGFGSGSEMVINSHLRGEACFDPESSYTPQARMYFDAKRIIADGLAVRDGVHFLKVYNKLDISKYLLLTVFEKDVPLPNDKNYWTPTSFTEAANKYFLNYIKEIYETDKERQARIYPIILSGYNPAWPDWFADEKANLERLIGKDNIARISHYGSTSVPGLTAKPTVDILLEIAETVDIEELIALMPESEYICLRKEGNSLSEHDLVMFLKGYLSDGFTDKVYHIHVRNPGDWDELYFRDYLISHPEAAAKYAELKRSLFNDYEHNRDGYTAAKGAFIKEITDKARKSL
jgi:GrpB-like predicted nucleotidyltransferase (UPF0157 family)